MFHSTIVPRKMGKLESVILGPTRSLFVVVAGVRAKEFDILIVIYA